MIFDKHAYCHITGLKVDRLINRNLKHMVNLLVVFGPLPIAYCSLPFVLSVFCMQRRKGKLRKAAKKISTNNLPLAHCLLPIAHCPKRILHAKTQRKTTQSRKEDIYK